MTYEDAKEKALAKKKEGLKIVTDDIYLLYQSFIESGFSDEQGFELTNTYIRQTMFDNILRENRKPSYSDIRERFKKSAAERKDYVKPSSSDTAEN